MECRYTSKKQLKLVARSIKCQDDLFASTTERIKRQSLFNEIRVPSLNPKRYNKVDENGDYYIKNVEDIQDVDQIVYNFMKGHGAKSAMFRVIKRDDGLMLGYVGVEFNTLDYDFEEQKKNLCKKADRIAGAMLYIKECADGEEED